MYGSVLEEISADMDFHAELNYEDAAYEVVEITDENYAKYAAIIRISYGGQTRDYYVAYHYEDQSAEDTSDEPAPDNAEQTADDSTAAESGE